MALDVTSVTGPLLWKFVVFRTLTQSPVLVPPMTVFLNTSASSWLVPLIPRHGWVWAWCARRKVARGVHAQWASTTADARNSRAPVVLILSSCPTERRWIFYPRLLSMQSRATTRASGDGPSWACGGMEAKPAASYITAVGVRFSRSTRVFS